MKNPTAPSIKFVFWMTIFITGVISYFNFGLAGYLFFPLLIFFFACHRIMKKNHLTSIENIMFAGFRLLFFVSMTERLDLYDKETPDLKNTDDKDWSKHHEMISYALTHSLSSETKAFFGVELDFLKKKHKMVATKLQTDIQTNEELEGINEYFLVQIDAIKKEFKDSKDDKKEYVIIRNWIIMYMARLLLVDGEISSAEKEAYNYIAKNLGVDDSEAESWLQASTSLNKEAILKTFEMIPDLTKKQIEYIDSEYEDLKELHDMSEEDIRDNLPAVSKAVARAIKKKLISAYK